MTNLADVLSGQSKLDTGILQGAIYLIKCNKNNKSYVGQTTLHPPTLRWKNNWNFLKNNAHPNKYLQDDWNKYGSESFSFVVVEYVHNKYIGEYEKKWIHSFCIDDCYNIQHLRVNNGTK